MAAPATQSAREQNLYLAKLAKEAERYEDMVAFMEKVSATLTGTDELTTEERYLLAIAYKNVIAARQASWRKISVAKSRRKSTLIGDYKAKVESEISSIAAAFINLLDSRLIRSASTGETKVYYLTLKGDYHRYLAEIKTGRKRKHAVDRTQAAYKAAQEIAAAQIEPAAHPVRLGVALNFSVFHYEILNSVVGACTVAKSAYEEAIAEMDLLDENSYPDSVVILEKLRDNIKLWISNLQDDDDDDDDDDVDDDEAGEGTSMFIFKAKRGRNKTNLG